MNASSSCLLLTHLEWQSGRSGEHEGPLLERKHKEFGRNRGSGRWSWRGPFLAILVLLLVSPSSCVYSTKRDNEVFYFLLYIERRTRTRTLKGFSRLLLLSLHAFFEPRSREGGSIFDGQREPTTGGKRHREVAAGKGPARAMGLAAT